jgi:integral membrane sensor domain MASE1
MVLQYWHFAVLAALCALVLWGLRASRRTTLFGLAAILVIISGWLLYTLVLEESYLEHDMEDVALIGIPAVLGISLGVLAVKGTRSRRA